LHTPDPRAERLSHKASVSENLMASIKGSVVVQRIREVMYSVTVDGESRT